MKKAITAPVHAVATRLLDAASRCLCQSVRSQAALVRALSYEVDAAEPSSTWSQALRAQLGEELVHLGLTIDAAGRTTLDDERACRNPATVAE